MSSTRARAQMEKREEVRKNLRAILSSVKMGMNIMRLVQDYRDLTCNELFSDCSMAGYRCFAEFCNDNLDAIDYSVFFLFLHKPS